MGITIRNGVVSGLRIGGNSDTAGWQSQTVKAGGRDITVKFEPGASLRQRQVQIGEGMFTTLAQGMSNSMDVNGLKVRSQDMDLWVNGQKIDFTGGGGDVAAPASNVGAKEALEKRFPGVEISGHEFLTIGPSVSIAAGAKIDGTPPGVVIDGDSKIGAGARVSGGTVVDSRIDGTVRSGDVRDSTIAAGATVDGGRVGYSKVLEGARVSNGRVSDSTIGPGSIVSGGNVSDTKTGSSCVISGGNLSDMKLGDGCVVSGGNLSDFTLEAGKVVSGGNHSGGLNGAGGGGGSVVVNGVSIRGGVFSGDVNVVLGNASGSIAALGDLVSGSSIVVGNGNVVVGNVSARDVVVGDNVSIVGLRIDRLG